MLTANEWTDWLSYHGSLFAGFRKWINDPEREDAILVWFGDLAQFSLDQLKAASAALVARADKPTGFTNHLAAILEIVRSHKPTNVNRYAHVCGLCGNTGRFYARAINGAVFETLQKKQSEIGIVACKCPAGERFALRRDRHSNRKIGFTVYDPQILEHV